MTDHLAFLRSDVDRVVWADETTIRHRGDRRLRQRTATTGLAVVAGVGVLGYSAIVGVPTDRTLGNPFLAASPSERTAPPIPAPGNRASASQALPPDQTSRPPLLPGSSPESSSWQFPMHTATASPGGTEPGSGPPSATGTAAPSSTPSPDSTTDTPTASPTTPELSADALLIAAEMPKVNDSATTWTATGDLPGRRESPASVCVSGDLASLGAAAAVRRDYTWGADGTVAGASVVGVFDTSAEAGSAYDTYARWLSGCSWGTAHGPTDVSVPSGVSGWWWIGHDNGDSSGQIEVVGLVRRAAAVAVVVWRQNGQDLSYDTDPMAPVLRAATDRLAADAAAAAER